MAYELAPLPYDYAALEPFIDAETMKLHHDKHHQTYINNVNAALEKHPQLAAKSVDDLIKDLNAIPEDIRGVVRNNGGGHSNHSAFWKLMGPAGSAGSRLASSILVTAAAPDWYSVAALTSWPTGCIRKNTYIMKATRVPTLILPAATCAPPAVVGMRRAASPGGSMCATAAPAPSVNTFSRASVATAMVRVRCTNIPFAGSECAQQLRAISPVVDGPAVRPRTCDRRQWSKSVTNVWSERGR